MKYILITGVSTGIGQGILVELIKNGYFVFGTVRNKKDSQRLEKEINSDLFMPILADVTDEKTVKAAFKTIQKKLGKNHLFGLINNAGILNGGPLVHLTLDEYRQIMEVNFFGTVRMMQTFIPLMPHKPENAHEAGRIINISSVFGHYGLPYVSTYSASKYAVEGFSCSVRRELEKQHIKVVVLIPGAVKTKIFEKGANDADYDHAQGTVYEHTGKNFRRFLRKREDHGITADRVGQKVLKILKSAHPKPRYHISGSPMIEWYLPKYLPDRLLDFILRKMFQ